MEAQTRTDDVLQKKKQTGHFFCLFTYSRENPTNLTLKSLFE